MRRAVKTISRSLQCYDAEVRTFSATNQTYSLASLVGGEIKTFSSRIAGWDDVGKSARQDVAGHAVLNQPGHAVYDDTSRNSAGTVHRDTVHGS